MIDFFLSGPASLALLGMCAVLLCGIRIGIELCQEKNYILLEGKQ